MTMFSKLRDTNTPFTKVQVLVLYLNAGKSNEKVVNMSIEAYEGKGRITTFTEILESFSTRRGNLQLRTQ
jgi:hypothetical protein